MRGSTRQLDSQKQCTRVEISRLVRQMRSPTSEDRPATLGIVHVADEPMLRQQPDIGSRLAGRVCWQGWIYP